MRLQFDITSLTFRLKVRRFDPIASMEAAEQTELLAHLRKKAEVEVLALIDTGCSWVMPQLLAAAVGRYAVHDENDQLRAANAELREQNAYATKHLPRTTNKSYSPTYA